MHGPSLPKLMNLKGPVYINNGVYFILILNAFLREDALIFPTVYCTSGYTEVTG